MAIGVGAAVGIAIGGVIACAVLGVGSKKGYDIYKQYRTINTSSITVCIFILFYFVCIC